MNEESNNYSSHTLSKDDDDNNNNNNNNNLSHTFLAFLSLSFSTFSFIFLGMNNGEDLCIKIKLVVK